MRLFFFLISIFSITNLFAQELTQKIKIGGLKFYSNPVEIFDRSKEVLISCEECVFFPEQNYSPFYTKKIPINAFISNPEVFIDVINEVEVPADLSSSISLDGVTENYIVSANVSFLKKKPFLNYSVKLIRKSPNGIFYFLTDFELRVESDQIKNKKTTPRSSTSFAQNSVLSSGTWYKFGVTQDAIYKLDRQFLQSLGIEVNSVNPNSLRIFGNGGAMLDSNNGGDRIDDLEEVSVRVIGGEDGKFDEEDEILFYGQSPHTWALTNNEFKHTWNLYSDTTYYFVSTDYSVGSQKNISFQNSSEQTAPKVKTFDDYQFYERDLINLIKSGRVWFGEQLGATPTSTFSFQFPNVDVNANARVDAAIGVRSLSARSSIDLSVSNTSFTTQKTFPEVFQGYDLPYVTYDIVDLEFKPSSSNLGVNLTLNKAVSTAVAWVDFVEVQVRRNLVYNGNTLFFRDINSLNSGVVEFEISSPPQNILVWEVTNHQNVIQKQGRYSGGKYYFSSNTNELHQFVAFKIQDAIKPQRVVGKIKNQNLHSLPQADMIIITHPDFLAYAEDLAEFHRVEDTLTVNTAIVQDIYNEFSSGKQDLTAIKDFIRMFYERAGTDSTQLPKYLLLFGDASYDFKTKSASNSNFVPAYQSRNSTAPTNSYVSDDYFGLLDLSEGESIADLVDIGIGRFPVKNKEEARNSVSKTKGYYSKSTFGAWRNIVSFVADDEDGIVSLIHMYQSDQLAEFVDTTYTDYHLEKIYFDAYKQESTPGGKRYPEVKNAINQRVTNGALIMNYIGHGGELGWSHERVLEVPDINKWNNKNKLPLFVTATCEFTRFDDPSRTSAGEYVFLNPDGGGIGLLTTTRLVFSQPNFDLSKQFNNIAYEKPNGRFPRLGDLNQYTKFNGPASVNSRCFSLIGDPAIKLAYPKLKVFATEVPDSMRALEKVTIKGFVANNSDRKLTDFQGIVYPTVYGKKEVVGTLNNDGRGVFKYNDQNQVIFKGKASVKNGEFEFSFVVPKDIDIEFGAGKISFYADNLEIDANGVYEAHKIGGIGKNIAADEKGPDIELFLNDESFVFGGLTNENPILKANLFDESGINTVGTGLGHDIVAVLDENTANAMVLNDFYESNLNSYQSGTINYQLPELAEGRHTLKLKAWDVHNNSGETELEFIVAKNQDLEIENLLNYPNPFTTNTSFYFDHNQPGQSLQVRLQVFTVSGKLVKTIDGFYYSEGFRAGPIGWNGKDEFGDEIGRGVYIYKVSAKTPTGKSIEKYQRLVILN